MFDQSKFVEVPAIEYQPKTNKNPRVIRFWNISLSIRLDQDSLDKVTKELHTKKKVSICRNSNNLLSWQYEGQPLVILDIINKRIGSTTRTIEEFGERKVQSQCSIVLKALKRYKLAQFRTASCTINRSRIGKTKEQRKITYEAWERMLNDMHQKKPKRRVLSP